jgi:acetyl esterase
MSVDRPDLSALAGLDVAQLRHGLSTLGSTVPVPFDGEVDDLVIPTRAGTVAARRYRPAGAEAPAPGFVFFHGGGFVLGDLDSHDGVCRELAGSADAVVVSVDYRLAPEHPYPAPVEDAVDATAWVAAQSSALGIDGDRLGVIGDSAGGGLAAAAALDAQLRGGPALALQVLVYPKLDFVGDHPSHHETATGLSVPPEMAALFDQSYIPDESRRAEPLASPLLAPDLSGLPRALVVAAEQDTLRDEGEAYGRRLAEAGVEVATMRAVGLGHGFLSMAAFDPGAALFATGLFAAAGRALRLPR